MTPVKRWRTVTAWKSGDESSAKWRLEDKVWKVGNMAMKIMALVVYNVAWAEAYLRTQWHHDPSSRLTTTDMGQKLGRLLWHFFVGGDNVAWVEAYLRTKCHLNPSNRLATTDMGRKLGDVPPFVGGAESPINTMSPWPRPTAVPSGILILQPFGHNGHGPKIGGLRPFWGELIPHLTQCGQGRGLPSRKASSWSI